MKLIIFLSLLLLSTGCYRSQNNNALAILQIQDRNGMTETISTPGRLSQYEHVDFTSAQPYKKVQRIYKSDGKNSSIITTYHPNGLIWKYLEAEEMRAHGTYREWFSNGQIKIEAKVINGTADLTPNGQDDWLFDSLSKVWDEKGNLIAEIPYENGALEGVSLYYFASGNIEKEVPFKKNQINGELKEYYQDGILKLKTLYQNGVKEGISIGYFNNSSITFTEEYENGLIQKAQYYNLKGETIASIENGSGIQAKYENNELALIEIKKGKPEGLIRQFTENGEMFRSYYFKNGKKHGEETEYYTVNGTPKLLVNWYENTIHGTVKTWYENGQLQTQREYSRNHRSGPSVAWYENGSLMFVEEYDEDSLVSGQYYKINKKEAISSIINGNGIATLYDEVGGLISKVPYVKGKPIDAEE